MSTPIYIATGLAFRDSFVVQTSAGTYTTGLSDASFTKKLSKDGVGGQSVTGITITEVSSVTNPGQYDLYIPATSFPAVAGEYSLLVYVTASPIYAFEQTFVVTPAGSPSGSGPVTFTSSTNNGRVSDGTTGISSATVTLINGSYIIQTTTDSNGNWGPIAFPASFGTVSLTASKSGYSTASGSLTVGASSATGPGTDLAISAIASGTTILASTLWAYAKRKAFNKGGAQAVERVKQAVNDALDAFAQAYDWNWYWRRGMLSINGAYTTGTLTLTNGSPTVTFSGASLPSWAGSGRLFVGSQILDILSRDSATQVTLVGNWNGSTTTGSSYTLFQDSYQLPTNFFEFGKVLEGQRWPYMPDPISIQEFWARQNAYTIGSQFAWCFAIAYNKLFLGPYPTSSMSAMYTYRVRPTPLVSESDVVDIDTSALGTLNHFINYFVALEFGEAVAGDAKTCYAAIEPALQRQIANDKSATQTAYAGGRRQGYQLPMWITKTTPI